MNLDQYTDRARTILQAAQGLAMKHKNQHFAPEHLLAALLDDDAGLSGNLIKAAGGRPDAAADLTRRAVEALPKVEGSGQLYLQPRTAEVFSTAEEAARKAGDQYVTAERLLQALSIPRTTPCSSASRAWARPPSPKAWRSASSRATCPKA